MRITLLVFTNNLQYFGEFFIPLSSPPEFPGNHQLNFHNLNKILYIKT